MQSPLSQKRLRRLLLSVAAPIIFFGVLELLLRVTGVGYPPGYVVHRMIDGKALLTSNPDFGKRFFDARRSRNPPLFAVKANRDPGTFRVVVLGGSAAMGDPYPSAGVPRMIEAMLTARHPGNPVEVINAAMTAINSHVVRTIARDCRRLKPDAIIIWMGNNEVVGPFGPASAFSPVLHDSPAAIRLSIWARGTRLGQLVARLRATAERETVALDTAWRGMEMFMDTTLRPGDSELVNVYANFSRNLEAICRAAENDGTAIVLCNVPVNLGACAPFESETGGASETYRLARFAEREEDFERARSGYERARDLDGLRFRADTEINRRIAKCALEDEAITFVDAVALFRAASSNGIPGSELFLDHVHPTFTGNYVMARAICDGLEDAFRKSLLRETGIADYEHAPYPTPAECGRAMAHTGWDAYRIADLMYARKRNPPFTNQFDHQDEMRRLSLWRHKLKPASQGPAMARAIERYQFVIMQRPDDWILRDHLATLLLDSGRVQEAQTQIHTALRLYPYGAQLRARLAATLALTGKIEDALDELRRSNPAVYSDKTAALEALANALQEKGRINEARVLFDRAMAEDPGRVSLHYHIGRLLLATRAPAEAEPHLRFVLEAVPDHAQTHAQLGVCLSQLGRREDALTHMRRAVELTPLNASRRSNLGGQLAGMGLIEDAIVHLEKAASLDPASADTCNNLAYTYSRLGRQQKAIAWYREASRLAPHHSRIRMSLADALFAAGEHDEARELAQEVLKHAQQTHDSDLIQFVQARLDRYGPKPPF